MDMSVKLNLSYPAAQPASHPVALDKSVERTPVAVVSSSAESNSSNQQGSKPDDESVKAAAEDIQKFFQSVKRNLEFTVDESSGKVVVKVIASYSGEVIRQIPNEEVLKLAESLSDAGSLLFNAEA